MNSLVSIVTVCLNSKNTIERTIKSVLSQTYPNIEYIIIDGKSIDGTVDIIKKYEECFNGNLTVVSEKDNGIYDAMNKGIRLARGEVIALLNSDDWYENDTIELVMQSYSKGLSCVIYGMLRRYKDNKEHSIQFLNSNFLETEGMCHSSCFISKEAYERCGLYDVQYKIVSDFDLLLRMKKNGVYFIPIYKVLTNFTMGGASSKYAMLKELNLIRYRYKIISRGRYLLRSMRRFLHLW